MKVIIQIKRSEITVQDGTIGDGNGMFIKIKDGEPQYDTWKFWYNDCTDEAKYEEFNINYEYEVLENE